MLKGIIDTGALQTIMSAAAASEEFGLVPGSPDMVQIGALGQDPRITFYSHKFSSLSFEGLVVQNPDIAIMADRMGAGRE